MASFVL